MRHAELSTIVAEVEPEFGRLAGEVKFAPCTLVPVPIGAVVRVVVAGVTGCNAVAAETLVAPVPS